MEIIETRSWRRTISIVLRAGRRGDPTLRRHRRWSSTALEMWWRRRRVSGLDMSGEGVRSVVAVVDVIATATATITTTTSAATVAS